MSQSHNPHKEHYDITLIQALADLAQARLQLSLLEEDYRQLEQRQVAHMRRAQLLGDALANERATKLAMQARIAELERQRHYLQGVLKAMIEPLAERAVGER